MFGAPTYQYLRKTLISIVVVIVVIIVIVIIVF